MAILLKMKLFLPFHKTQQVFRDIVARSGPSLLPLTLFRFSRFFYHSTISKSPYEWVRKPMLEPDHTALAWLHRKRTSSTVSSSTLQIGQMVELPPDLWLIHFFTRMALWRHFYLKMRTLWKTLFLQNCFQFILPLLLALLEHARTL